MSKPNTGWKELAKCAGTDDPTQWDFGKVRKQARSTVELRVRALAGLRVVLQVVHGRGRRFAC